MRVGCVGSVGCVVTSAAEPGTAVRVSSWVEKQSAAAEPATVGSGVPPAEGSVLPPAEASFGVPAVSRAAESVVASVRWTACA